jgi:hypothetical protein
MYSTINDHPATDGEFSKIDVERKRAVALL